MIPQIEEVNFPSYATLHQATVSLQEMGERTISTQVRIDGDIAPEYGVWNQAHTVFSPMELVFKGERFILPIREPQASKDNTTRDSISELTFYSWPIYQLKRYFFFSYDPQNTSTAVAEQYNASVKLNLTNFGILFNRVLNYYFNGAIVMDVSSSATTEAVIIEINYSYLWDVLTKVYEVFGKRWYIERNSTTGVYTIKVGYPDRTIDGHVFEYGYEGGLLKFERQVQDPEIYNILLGRGGEKNLPYRYFKQELTENGTTWRGDPDAIPELASIYFDKLRDINFRWYIRGWVKNTHRSTAHDEGYTLPDYDDDDVPPDYLWAYRKGRYQDTSFSPVEYVKDDASIAKYGELWGAADDFDDVFPTIQGRYADGIGRVDESVAFSEIITDDIQAVAESAAVETTLADVSIALKGNYQSEFTLVSAPFTIPTGKTANASFAPFGKDSVLPSIIYIDTENTDSKAVSHNTGISDISGTSTDIAAIPAGTWHIEFTLKLVGVDASQWRLAWGDFGFNNIRISMSAIDADAWKPTFDIWVKNIWGTTKGANETAQAYAERVWLPILGDRWGKEAKIVFSDGKMSVSEDYEFIITSIPVYDTSKQITTTNASGTTIIVPSHWKITLRKSDAELEALGVYIPSSQPQQKPVAGDHFYFIGVDLPQQYILWAEEQLNGTAFTPHINKKAILDGQADINPSWVVTLDKVRSHTVEAADLGTALVDRLATGALLSTRDARFTGGETIQLYITSLSYTWSEPTENEPNIVPNIEVVLSDKIASVSSAFSKLQGEVNYIQRSYATNEDIEAVVRRIASEFFLKKNGEPDASQSPTSFASKVQSADFNQGQITGQGWGIYRSNAPAVSETPATTQDSILELDVLRVRKSLEVNELIINQTTHVGGKRIQSAASIACTEVVDDGTNYLCYFDQKQGTVSNLFVVDDIAFLQTFDADNNSIRYCKRRVVAVGINYIALSKTDADGTGVPQKDDVLVQYGNYTNAARQYAIVQDVIGGGYEQMVSGLNSVSATGVEYYFAGRRTGTNPRWFVGNRTSGQYAEFANGRMTIAGPATIGQDGNATTIEGNLVQTGTISLGSVTNNVFSVWAGMSGVYDTSLNDPNKSIAAWYGGSKVDHEASPTAPNYAKTLFRFDGSGYQAGGNIYWDASGYGGVPGITWDSTGIKVTNDLKIETSTGTFETLVAAIRAINNMFTFEPATTGAGAHDDRIRANFDLYGVGYISAEGSNSGGGGGGGATDLYQLNDVLASGGKVARYGGSAAAQAGDLFAYNGTAWYALQLGTNLSISNGVLNATGGSTGTVTKVQLGVDGVVYNPDENGKVQLPFYAGGTKVTLNGTDKGASTASFYAPTGAGTSGQWLKSNGSGAPSWSDLLCDMRAVERFGSAKDVNELYETSTDYYGHIRYYANIQHVGTTTYTAGTNGFPTNQDGRNGILLVSTYAASNQPAGYQLGFSANGKLYYRYGGLASGVAQDQLFVGKTWNQLLYQNSNGDATISRNLTLGGNLIPSSTSCTLGTDTKYWGDLYLKSGGIVYGGDTARITLSSGSVDINNHLLPAGLNYNLGADAYPWAGLVLKSGSSISTSAGGSGATATAQITFGSSAISFAKKIIPISGNPDIGASDSTWGDLYLKDGGKIYAASNARITVNSTDVTFGAKIIPSTQNTEIGKEGKAWGDIWLYPDATVKLSNTTGNKTWWLRFERVSNEYATISYRDIIPMGRNSDNTADINDTGTRDLGKSDRRWRNVYSKNVNLDGDIYATGITASTASPSSGFQIYVSEDGTTNSVIFEAYTNVITMQLPLYVKGNINPHGSSGDYNLGNSRPWNNIYARRFLPQPSTSSNSNSTQYITFDSTNSAIKIEGNLIVSGFVTAEGANGSDFTTLDLTSLFSYAPTSGGVSITGTVATTLTNNLSAIYAGRITAFKNSGSTYSSYKYPGLYRIVKVEKTSSSAYRICFGSTLRLQYDGSSWTYYNSWA